MQIQERFKLYLFLFVAFILLNPGGPVKAAPEEPEKEEPSYIDELRVILKEGKEGELGTRYYWEDGLHIESRKHNFSLKIGGDMELDMAYIDANDDLGDAFSDPGGFEGELRRLQISSLLTMFDALEFKLDVDFANIRAFKDIWIRYKKSPFLSHFTFGHVKEPFSLENLTGFKSITFLERALPVKAFSPGRNIGLMFNNAELNERITYAAGFFWNTSSSNVQGDPQDGFSDSNGSDITIRVTGLPQYEDEGRRLWHLGISFSRGTRNGGSSDPLKVKTTPESHIGNSSLVDTDDFFADKLKRINAEVAVVSGPLFFQSELIFYSAEVDGGRDPDFWGYYLYSSYFFTGEHREYDKADGVFSSVRPKRNFSFLREGWGAWELALRHSFIDLNDADIKGGKERNFTLGINWYLKPKIRMMLNYIRADIEDRDNSRVIDNGSANIFQFRYQIRF